MSSQYPQYPQYPQYGGQSPSWPQSPADPQSPAGPGSSADGSAGKAAAQPTYTPIPADATVAEIQSAQAIAIAAGERALTRRLPAGRQDAQIRSERYRPPPPLDFDVREFRCAGRP